MPGRNVLLPTGVNVSGRYRQWPVFNRPLMAGFQPPTNGRFWVPTEGRTAFALTAHSSRCLFLCCGGIELAPPLPLLFEETRISTVPAAGTLKNSS